MKKAPLIFLFLLYFTSFSQGMKTVFSDDNGHKVVLCFDNDNILFEKVWLSIDSIQYFDIRGEIIPEVISFRELLNYDDEAIAGYEDILQQKIRQNFNTNNILFELHGSYSVSFIIEPTLEVSNVRILSNVRLLHDMTNSPFVKELKRAISTLNEDDLRCCFHEKPVLITLPIEIFPRRWNMGML